MDEALAPDLSPDNPCPKCGHRRARQAVPVCPACGLVFAKWAERNQFIPPARRRACETAASGAESDPLPWLGCPPDTPTSALAGRALLWGFIALWGWRLAWTDYRDDSLLQSFMHLLVILPHEAGHLIFRPLGEFMGVAGGSLFQVLLPLICGGVLLKQNRDAFGAGLALWWAGASLVDLSAYIYDALAPALPLIGGGTGEDRFHDWIYLLEKLDRVAHAPRWAAADHTLGVLLMLAGLGWAAASLWHSYRASTRP